MAKAKSLDAKVSALSRLVEKGFAAISHDIAHRPTNSSIAAILENYVAKIPSRKQMTEMLGEPLHTLASIRKDLAHLTDSVDNIRGLPKEIDHALERIAAIERHLGLNKKIAA